MHCTASELLNCPIAAPNISCKSSEIGGDASQPHAVEMHINWPGRPTIAGGAGRGFAVCATQPWKFALKFWGPLTPLLGGLGGTQHKHKLRTPSRPGLTLPALSLAESLRGL
jgi:hypothetical protein